MPTGNQFAHQRYLSQRPTASYEQLVVGRLPAVGSAQYAQRMRSAGRSLRRARVGAIVLVHGTFVGNDPVGLHAMLLGSTAGAYQRICRWTKACIDRFISDVGNYPASYAAELSTALGAEPPIPVHRFVWSGVNNHAGRAVAAVQLIGYMMSLKLPAGQRILLCGHSHGGNVLALLTNLLSADRGGLARFLEAVGGYARRFDKAWPELESLLQAESRPLATNPLDLVTMGMPIRYGFETSGYDQLLHFINHRPSYRIAEYRTTRPTSVGELFAARQGDYVQQFGIAGSNFSVPLDRSMWVADRRLAEQLAAGLSCWGLPNRIRTGMRVPEEGRTLLIDYGETSSRWLQDMLGHGVYTHSRHVLLHMEQIVRCFYRSTS